MSLSRHFIYFFAFLALFYKSYVLYAKEKIDVKKDTPVKSNISTTTTISTTSTTTSIITTTIPTTTITTLQDSSSKTDITLQSTTTTSTTSSQQKIPLSKTQVHIQRKIDKLHQRLEKRPNNLNLHFLLGKYYYLLKDFDKAILHLKKTNTNPSAKTLILLAKIFSHKKDYKEEIRILSMLLEMHPDSSKVHTDIATAYYKNKEMETAIEHYKIALQKNPKYKGAYKGLWTVFEAQDNFYDMRQVVVDFLAISPKDIEAHSKLCQANLKSRFADESISACNQAIKINPSYPNNHVYLGLAHKWNGNNKQAEKIIFDAAKKFKRSLLAQYEAGLLAEEKKLLRSALTFYRNCVKSDSRSFICIMKTAHLEVHFEQYEEATQSFLSACKINKFTTFPKIRDAAGKMRIEKKMERYYHFKKVAERCHIVGERRLEKAPYEPLTELIVEEAPPEIFEDPEEEKKKGAKKKSLKSKSKATKKKATKTKK